MSELNRNTEINHLSATEKAELLAKLKAEAPEIKPEQKVVPAETAKVDAETTLTPKQTVMASTNISTDVSLEKQAAAVDQRVIQQRLEKLLNSDEGFDPQALTDEVNGL